MRKILFVPVLIAALMIAALLFTQANAGPVLVTEEDDSGMVKLTFDWTTPAGTGVYSDTTIYHYTGKVIKAYIVPSTISAPTDDYDVRLLDEGGIDILDGFGVDSGTATVEVLSNVGAVLEDTLTISVTNAGTSTAGVVYVYLEK